MEDGREAEPEQELKLGPAFRREELAGAFDDARRDIEEQIAEGTEVAWDAGE